MGLEQDELYDMLVEFLSDHDVVMWDTDWGPGVSVSLAGTKSQGVVVVCGKRPFVQRLFILAHEAGHLFRAKMNGDTFKLKRRKRSGSEQQANDTAALLLDQVDVRLKYGLAKFYNKINHCWIESGHRKPYVPKKRR